MIFNPFFGNMNKKNTAGNEAEPGVTGGSVNHYNSVSVLV